MADKPDNYESGLSGASQDVARFEVSDKSLMMRFQGALHKNPSLVPLIVLICAIMIFTGWLGPRFLPQMSLVFQQIQVVGILALAQTLVILTAGIDLSVGAIAVFCSVVMGKFTFDYGLPPAISVACGIAAGAGIGAISGYLVTRIKIPPFIATLGVWQIVLAANYIYSRNETIRARTIREEAPMLQWLGLKPNEQFVIWIENLRGITYERIRPNDTGQFMLDLIWQTKITYGVLALIGLTILLAYMLRSTAWGRHVYAVGDDPDAAELAGVNVKRTLMSVYMLAGAIAAIAGWSLIGRFASVSPSASTGLEGNIESITAVVI
ncbi:MAG: ABC transporter permease, partial [Pseudomonadota bacterium]